MGRFLVAMAAALVGLAATGGTAAAQDVAYLGDYDTAGVSVSVTPLDAMRLEYCTETTSGQRDCIVTDYEMTDGLAMFRSRDAEPLAFDLVTNVLTLTRSDGRELTADMRPVAR